MTSLPLDDACLTSEPLAEQQLFEPRLLKGFSLYIIAKNKRVSTLLKEDSTLVQLKRGLFARNRTNGLKSWVPLNDTSDILLLVPRRDITKLRGTTQHEAEGMRRRFVLVIYRSLKTELLRKQFSRAIERIPVVRVRPGLLLVPQIPNSRYRKYESILQRPSKFISTLTSLGTPVWFVPRVELINSEAHKVINALVKNMVGQRAHRIFHMCKRLYKDVKRIPEGANSIAQFQKRLNRIKRHFRYLRWQARFFKEEFGIDLQPYVNRALSAVGRVHRQMKKCDSP